LKTLTLLSFQFYRITLYFNIACTLLAIAVVWYGLGHVDAGGLFLAKILAFPGAVMLHRYIAKENYYYFRNAGCRMRQIITITFVADIFACIILFSLINLVT